MNIKSILYTLTITALLVQPKVFAADDGPAKFADINWLTTRTSVKEIAKKKEYTFLSEDKESICFKGTLLGKSAEIGFIFNQENQLVKTMILLQTKENECIATYEKLEKSLSDKYGKPTRSVRTFDKTGGTEEQAIKNKTAFAAALWENRSIGINIEQKLIILIQYESKYWNKELESKHKKEAKDL